MIYGGGGVTFIIIAYGMKKVCTNFINYENLFCAFCKKRMMPKE